jgi:hypothetical protein
MNESTAPASADEKRRHGCLTAWLFLSVAANALVALYYVAALLGAQLGVAVPLWALLLLTAVGAVNIVCLVAIFKWKKWGFWGLLLTALGVFGLNLSLGLNPATAVLGLAGPAVMFGVLNIGDSNKGWTQLG